MAYSGVLDEKMHNKLVYDILLTGIKLPQIDHMTKLKIIEGIFEKTLVISYSEGAHIYYANIPARICKAYGTLPKRVTAATSEKLIDKLFDMLISGKTVSGKTLSDIFNDWVREREADEDAARHTIRKYHCDWENFIKPYPIASAPIASITPQDLYTHFKEITKGRKMRRKAFGNVKTLCNQLWDYAYRQNLVNANISRTLNTRNLKFMVVAGKSDKTYTPEERIALCDYLAASDNPLDLVIVIMFCLGCRVGEAKALWWSDINFERGEITIQRELVDDEGQTILRPCTKNGMEEGTRTLPLTDRARRIFERIPKPEDKDSLIFLWNGKGLKTQTINSHLERACKALGIIYLSTHKIRATQITHALASGMDQASVMRIAGHATPETIRHYVRVGRVNKDISAHFNEAFN